MDRYEVFRTSQILITADAWHATVVFLFGDLISSAKRMN